MITIRNKQTGEIKEIQEGERSRYNIIPRVSEVSPPETPISPEAPTKSLGQRIGESPFVPMAAGMGAAAFTPPIPGLRGLVGGTAAVTAERGQKLLRGEAPPEVYQWGFGKEKMKAMLPTGEELKKIGGATALDIAIFGLSKVIRPHTTLRSLQESPLGKVGAKKMEFSGKEIGKAGLEYVKDDELAETYAKRIVPSLSKQKMTIEGLLKKMDIWGRAYNAAKEVKDSSKAGFYGALYSKARQMLAEQMPTASALRSLSSGIYDIERVGKWILPPFIVYEMLRRGLTGQQGGYYR